MKTKKHPACSEDYKTGGRLQSQRKEKNTVVVAGGTAFAHLL
jgi:hypothetical protein